MTTRQLSLIAALRAVRSAATDWMLEQRIAAVKGRLVRCHNPEASRRLMDQLRSLVARRSPAQVARMEKQMRLR